MENMTKLRKRKGVSPVIATVILVAVTITVAVAVAYWMSGIAGQYTSFEKVEIQSAVITYESPAHWQIGLCKCRILMVVLTGLTPFLFLSFVMFSMASHRTVEDS